MSVASGASPDAALQRAIAEACLGARAGEAIAEDLRGWLEERGVPADDVEAILAAPPRLGVYRSLVRNGLSSVVLRMLPRTRARMNAACAGRFDVDLAAFVDEVGPRTHYLRDVPAEYLAWAGPRWRADASVPAYLAELATHELTQFAVAAAAPASCAAAACRSDARPSAAAPGRDVRPSAMSSAAPCRVPTACNWRPNRPASAVLPLAAARRAFRRRP